MLLADVRFGTPGKYTKLPKWLTDSLSQVSKAQLCTLVAFIFPVHVNIKSSFWTNHERNRMFDQRMEDQNLHNLQLEFS